MRVVAILVAVLGLFVLALGVIFLNQAGSAEKTIADEIQPLKVADVNTTYDGVKAKQLQLAKAEGAAIQAGNPSGTYTYLTLQRTSLGLTKANLGVAQFVRTAGIVNIVLGAGVLLLALGMLTKVKPTA
jgi:tRNA U34 2-thiouridine synthase MnmA/TrmU